MSRPVRYHPLLVWLHWLLAALILASLAAGFLWLDPAAIGDAQKIPVLRVHMAAGALILVLTVARLVVRRLTGRPGRADRLTPPVHAGLYALVFLMVATGFATAILTGTNLVVFGSGGGALPAGLERHPARVAHGWLAILLAGLIGAHLLVVLHHQLVRRDGLLSRMGFGRD